MGPGKGRGKDVSTWTLLSPPPLKVYIHIYIFIRHRRILPGPPHGAGGTKPQGLQGRGERLELRGGVGSSPQQLVSPEQLDSGVPNNRPLLPSQVETDQPSPP